MRILLACSAVVLTVCVSVCVRDYAENRNETIAAPAQPDFKSRTDFAKRFDLTAKRNAEAEKSLIFNARFSVSHWEYLLGREYAKRCGVYREKRLAWLDDCNEYYRKNPNAITAPLFSVSKPKRPNIEAMAKAKVAQQRAQYPIQAKRMDYRKRSASASELSLWGE